MADIATMYEVLVEVGEDFVHTESPDDDEDSDDDEDLAARLHLCVPFALPDDGGFALVDHRPGPTYGHVYELGIGSGDLDGTLWATSLTALFRALSDAVETGTPFLHYWPTTTKDESGRAHLAWQIQP
ncbi:hypothetical protein AB0G76_11805 [Streptomyces asoensis]|uniref:hypothetical protein n=1 Tax=Streptomyces asoensis TaxID=249586 RepID=UPI00340FBE01